MSTVFVFSLYDVTETKNGFFTAQDKYMRALAEAENTRRRSAIEIENQKQFAITKFAQSLLEVCCCHSHAEA